jgi:hypothetical protein
MAIDFVSMIPPLFCFPACLPPTSNNLKSTPSWGITASQQ